MSSLSDEGFEAEAAILMENAHRFLSDVVDPHIVEAERSGTFPWAIWPEVAAFGYIGIRLPSASGGQELSFSELAVLMEAAGYHWLGFRALLNVHNMVAAVLERHGTAQQKASHLQPLLRGERRVWVGITEPNVGSNVNGIETRARRRDGGFLISGAKQWITNGGGDFGVLLARTYSDTGEDLGLSTFLVDRSEVDYSIRPLETMILRCTGTSELIFDDMFLPEDRLLGACGQGLKTTLTTLNEGRLSVAAGAVGAAQCAFDMSLDYATSRKQFGKLIGQYQLIQQHLVEQATLVRASRQLVREAGRCLDGGGAARLECSIAKKFATESAFRVADLALQVHGGVGYSTDLPLERIFRDTRGGIIPEGTSEIQTLIIGRELTGLSAF
jgi:acyl-CoA dehydrogenase